MRKVTKIKIERITDDPPVSRNSQIKTELSSQPLSAKIKSERDDQQKISESQIDTKIESTIDELSPTRSNEIRPNSQVKTEFSSVSLSCDMLNNPNETNGTTDQQIKIEAIEPGDIKMEPIEETHNQLSALLPQCQASTSSDLTSSTNQSTYSSVKREFISPDIPTTSSGLSSHVVKTSSKNSKILRCLKCSLRTFCQTFLTKHILMNHKRRPTISQKIIQTTRAKIF
jgi:hypothetical protein